MDLNINNNRLLFCSCHKEDHCFCGYDYQIKLQEAVCELLYGKKLTWRNETCTDI